MPLMVDASHSAQKILLLTIFQGNVLTLARMIHMLKTIQTDV